MPRYSFTEHPFCPSAESFRAVSRRGLAGIVGLEEAADAIRFYAVRHPGKIGLEGVRGPAFMGVDTGIAAYAGAVA